MRLRYGLKEESFKLKWGEGPCTDCDFAAKTVRVCAGRNDRAAFQVIVDCDEDANYTVGSHPVFSEYGELPCVSAGCEGLDGIAPGAVSVSLIGMIPDDDGVMTADLLLSQETIRLTAGRACALWIEIKTPADLAPGKYSGAVVIRSARMFEDEREEGRLGFTVEVKNALLPSPAEFRFKLDLWQHLSNIARKHETPLWSDAHFEVVERYVQSLAELGQKAITVIASEIPWSGQNCFRTQDYPSDLFEYSMARIFRNPDGSYEYDFSAMERYIKMCMRHGITSEIEVFGLVGIWKAERNGEKYGRIAPDYPDAIRLRYLDRADGLHRYIKDGDGIRAYIKALADFFIHRRWINIVRVAADEPTDIEAYREQTAILKKICPRFRFKAAIYHGEFMENFRDTVDDFVPILNTAAKDWKSIIESKKRLRGNLLWYVCCWPARPNTFIKSPLLESRLIGYLTYYLGFDGFLRWNYTVWPAEPRRRMSYRAPSWFAGDMNFVYPSPAGGPLLTLRYKNLLRGIEEYEMIAALYSGKSSRGLHKVWERLIRAPGPEAFEKASETDAEMLYSLEHGDYDYCRELLLDSLERQQTRKTSKTEP